MESRYRTNVNRIYMLQFTNASLGIFLNVVCEYYINRRISVFRSIMATIDAFGSVFQMPGECKAATRLIAGNEENNTLTLTDGDDMVTGPVPTCSRPGGVMFGPECKEFYVACTNDSQIAIYCTLSLRKLQILRSAIEAICTAAHRHCRERNCAV